MNADDAYKASKCEKDGQICNTADAAWQDPSTAPDKATCAAGTDPTWPPTQNPAAGSALTGDYCTKNEDCFKQDGDKIKCDTTAKICTSTLQPGDACADIKECPANHYCKDAKCTPAVAADADCSATDPCQYGLFCVASDDALTKFTCIKQGTLAEGKQFKLPGGIPTNFVKVEAANADFFLVPSCQTRVAMALTDGKLQCRKGPVSASQSLSSLKQSKIGAECKITVTDDPDPANFNKAKDGTVLSKCGFNQDSSAYCSVQLGDDYVTKALSDAYGKATAPNAKCHPLSGSDQNGATACVDAYNTSKDKAFATAARRAGEASGQSYHLTANNDKCVAAAITQRFWRGQFGNSAMQLGVIGTVSVFAFLLAFIY